MPPAPVQDARAGGPAARRVPYGGGTHLPARSGPAHERGRAHARRARRGWAAVTDEKAPLLPSDLASLDILRRRAESLAHESEESVSEDLTGILLFDLGEELYGVPIEHVREIYQEYAVTRIPCVPDHIHGVINIRGEIVSVTGLAELMHLPRAEGVRELQAIVVQNAECVTAMAVDEIGDIVEVPKDSIEPPISVIGKAQAEFVAGSVYVDGRLVGLINLDRVLQPVEGA
ncbi:MAG: hypothetical protein C0418_01335 [Coriobacteriaceae bacterium]|nr:hypothetical protein [Coriobacteriaceae bacterium]